MKRKKPDNIDLDVRRAELLGYGIHYGRYKADYPNTKGMDPEQEDSDGIPYRVCAENRGQRKGVNDHKEQSMANADQIRHKQISGALIEVDHHNAHHGERQAHAEHSQTAHRQGASLSAGLQKQSDNGPCEHDHEA